MTMPDPLGLREFGYVLAAGVGDDGETHYAYRVRITRGELLEYESPWAPLLASTEEAARSEAVERTTQVMVLTQGARVESLAPRGIGDDGLPTT